MKSLEIKRMEAKSRQDFYNSLTPQQRLDNLDRIFGKGVGAAKERARLNKLVEKNTLAKDVATISKAVVKEASKFKKGRKQ